VTPASPRACIVAPVYCSAGVPTGALYFIRGGEDTAATASSPQKSAAVML
jgi:hypothetical protein